MRSSRRFGTCRRGLKCQRCIPRSTSSERGSRPSRSESSIQFGWPGVHPLEVESVAVVEPDRERVVADLSVEPRVEPLRAALADAAVRRRRAPRRAARGRRRAGPPTAAASSRGTRKTVASSPGEPLAEPVDDPVSKKTRIESRSGRTSQTRRPSADSRAKPLRRSARASDAPSSPWCRSASAGVPHAGQPSTPKTVSRSTPELAAERVAEPADRRVVLEHEDVLVRLDLGFQPVGVEAVQPRHVHDCEARCRRSSSELRREERLVEHHRPVGEEDRIAPSRSTTPRPTAGS